MTTRETLRDEELVSQARNNDITAFEELFRRHHMNVHAFAYRCCLDHAAAQDIAQETFVKAARALADLREDAAFKAWLYRIALSLTRDWQRRRQRSLQLQEAFAQSARLEASERPADHVAVTGALAALPAAWRAAVVLVFYEQMSHAEAARALNCAETTVSWRLFRAKRQLKKLLSRRV